MSFGRRTRKKQQARSPLPRNVATAPTLLALTRQAVPMLNEIDAKTRREGVARGGYIAKREERQAGSYSNVVRERIAARHESRGRAG